MKKQKGEAITVFAIALFFALIGVTAIASNNHSKAEKLEAAAAVSQQQK